jgi:hypothetical protein
MIWVPKTSYAHFTDFAHSPHIWSTVTSSISAFAEDWFRKDGPSFRRDIYDRNLVTDIIDETLHATD